MDKFDDLTDTKEHKRARQQKRRDALNKIAKDFGFDSWDKLGTAAINSEITISIRRNEMSVDSVFFGIMEGDLFGDEDVEQIDGRASVRKYAELVTVAITAEHGSNVEVDWNSQNVGGAVPYGLKTKVNGETDHDEVPTIDEIIGRVWQDWEWVVYND